jgi:hypothetical protein
MVLIGRMISERTLRSLSYIERRRVIMKNQSIIYKTSTNLANSESLDGSEAMMSETFFMSNMVPQCSGQLNLTTI